MQQQNTFSSSQTQSTPYTFTTVELDSLRGKLQTAEEQMSGFNSKNAQYIMQLSLNETRTLQKMIDMTYLQGLRLQTPSSSGVYPPIQTDQEMKWSNGPKSGGNNGMPPSDYVCHKCGIEGHYVHDCPNVIGKGAPPSNYVCRKCNIQGHWIDECPLGNQQDTNKSPPLGYCCYRCGIPGHWIKNCPTNETRSDNPRGRDRDREKERPRERKQQGSGFRYPQKMSEPNSSMFSHHNYNYNENDNIYNDNNNYNDNNYHSSEKRFHTQPDPSQNPTYVKKMRHFNGV